MGERGRHDRSCLLKPVASVRIPLPPPLTQEISILRTPDALKKASRRRCFGEGLCTWWRALWAVSFSEGPFFSQPVYHCGSVQSFGGPYFGQLFEAKFEVLSLHRLFGLQNDRPTSTWRTLHRAQRSSSIPEQQRFVTAVRSSL